MAPSFANTLAVPAPVPRYDPEMRTTLSFNPRSTNAPNSLINQFRRCGRYVQQTVVISRVNNSDSARH